MKTLEELRDETATLITQAVYSVSTLPDDDRWPSGQISNAIVAGLCAAEKLGYDAGLSQGFVDGSRLAQREGEKRGIEQVALALGRRGEEV